MGCTRSTCPTTWLRIRIPTLAALSRHGVTYTNNSTSTPSDSFPGLASLVTGGSPVTTGLWYDDTYNRALSPPAQTDGLGNPGGSCPGTVGTNVAWDEAVDIDLTRLDAGGGLNPKFLVRDPQNGCRTILPHEYLRVNTIFEVVRAAGGRTAWTDKHPSYEWTNGPSGKGVDDFYGPEINSIPVALPQFPVARRCRSRIRRRTMAGPTVSTTSSATTAARAGGAQSDRRLQPRSHGQSRRAHAVRHELPGGQRRREAGRRSGHAD